MFVRVSLSRIMTQRHPPPSAAPTISVTGPAAVARSAITSSAGSGTRLLVEHLLAEQGLSMDDLRRAVGTHEDSHLAVAAAVAAGEGEVGLGIEAAARQFGLDFVPLVSEAYYVVCLQQTLELPAVRALRQVLQQAAWADTLASLPGYQPAHAGEVLSLTRALPWWQFRSAKDKA